MYILECGNGAYYVGSTDNLKFRVRLHQDGKGGYVIALSLSVVETMTGEFFARSLSVVETNGATDDCLK